MRRDYCTSFPERRIWNRYSGCSEVSESGKKILEIVEEKLQIELDETSLHYERFVTHIKFCFSGVYRKELLPDEESELAELMQKKYQKEYDCSKMVAAYIEEETKCSLSGEEIMYLAIHIRRVTTAEE